MKNRELVPRMTRVSEITFFVQYIGTGTYLKITEFFLVVVVSVLGFVYANAVWCFKFVQHGAKWQVWGRYIML